MRQTGQLEHTFPVQFSPPLDIAASLAMFQRAGDDGIDRWDGQTLVRTTRLGNEVVPFTGTLCGTAPALEITVAHPSHAAAVEYTVRTMFVTAPEPFVALIATDPVIAGLAARYPGLHPVLQADLFTALVRAISAQQVNLRWATITRRRLADAFGCQHTIAGHQVFSLDAARLAAAEVAALRALQCTTRKAEYLVALASAVATGSLDLEALRQQPDAEVIARLTACRGLGRWSAEWFLARALGRPRVVAGDLGVRKAVGAAYLNGRLPSEAEVRALTAHWGAAAGVAQQLLLHALSQGW
jgi:DNA-3-methyladenine glycosylase II